MVIIPTMIPEVLIIEQRIFSDDRGFFMESYNESNFSRLIGKQIHFVQDNDDLLQSQQRQQVRVSFGLLFNTLCNIDDQHGSFCLGGAGNHVLDKLHMPWRVNYDVTSPGSPEEDLRCIDRDSLFAFFL